MKNTVGHKALQDSLATLIESNHFPQSNLFYGLEGIGKKRIALDLVVKLFEGDASDSPDLFGDDSSSSEESQHSQMVRNEAHPDLFFVKPSAPKSATEKEKQGDVQSNWTIKVEQIEELRSKLTHHPLMSNHQVIIIDDADRMTTTAANSLLKWLEEPRPHQIFILITSQFHRVLMTIRSRCAKFFFKPLDRDSVFKIFEQNDFDLAPEVKSKASLDFYYECFQGSVRKMLQMMESGLTPNQLQDLVVSSSDFLKVQSLVDQILDSKIDLQLFLQVLRRVALDQSYQNASQFFVEFLDRIQSAEVQLNRHIQKNFVLENIFLS